MEFSLKIVVSIMIGLGAVLLLSLLITSQTSQFPAFVNQILPLN